MAGTATLMPVTGHPVSGHVKIRPGKRRNTWYMKYRDASGVQREKVVGPAWERKGPPPPGWFREKEAQAVLEAILTDARRGVVEQIRTGRTFEWLSERYIAYGIHERDWKPGTLADNRSAINKHLNDEFGDLPPEKITAEMIEDWRDTLVDDLGLSRRQANKLHTILGAVLEHGCKKHGLLRNRARDVEKLKERYDPNSYDFYDPDEIYALVAAAKAPKDTEGNEYKSDWRAADAEQDGVLFLTAALTGLRLGELRALPWHDVDFDAQTIRVYNSYSFGTLTAPKSGLSRTVPLADQVATELKAHRDRVPHDRGDLVFPGHRGEYLDSTALRKRFKKAIEQAKLRPLRFHDLRHTFGSLMINQASIVQVQEWMGHADIQTTRKYLHHRHRPDDAKLATAAFAPKKTSNDPEPVAA